MRLHSDNINVKYAKWLDQLSYDLFLNEQISSVINIADAKYIQFV